VIVWRTICKGCRWELSWNFLTCPLSVCLEELKKTIGNVSQCIQETIPARIRSKRFNQ
jgi:hypothetical protein